MIEEKDYRNTPHCPVTNNLQEKKRSLEEEIWADFPRTRIIYNKVRVRDSKYHDRFAEIYHKKCAYCGALWGILSTECFEIDHYINEKSFPDTIDGRAKAGRMSNLVWACVTCNRGKGGITLVPPYDAILNPDDGSISKAFVRDEKYCIHISEPYESDIFINRFYNALHLDYETRRLDYLLLELHWKSMTEENEARRNQYNSIFIELLKKRNTLTK